MKSLPEEIAYLISNISYNPFFYLINGIWNKENFDKLLRKNYTFPSLLRRLIRSNETKILQKLLSDYKEEIQTFPLSLQNDILHLLQPQRPTMVSPLLTSSSSTSLASSTYSSFSPSSPSSPPHSMNSPHPLRKVSEATIYIPRLKTLTVEDIENGWSSSLFPQLHTGEYTYIREEKEMADYMVELKAKFQEIKESITDANGAIPSATEKTENPIYCFIYLYGLVSSLNFASTTQWNQNLLNQYHPSYIKIKVTRELLDSFKYLNNAFECTEPNLIKQTYTVLKEMYEECHLRIKSKEYMSFIFDHKEYEPLILDTLNNLPLMTWKILHASKDTLRARHPSMEHENFDHESYNDIQEIELPSDQHNILYILTHNFFLGMYPSCHLFYLYDQYIEAILKFYDEDNDQIFKYYSGISSNPDETFLAFFYYTALILLLRSPHIRCLFDDPEADIRERKLKAQQIRKLQPTIFSAMLKSNRKVIYVGNPLSARSIDIERFLPHLSTSSSSSTSSPSTENQLTEINHELEHDLTENTNDQDEFKDIEKKFRVHIPNTEEPIAYISGYPLEKTPSLNTPSASTSSSIVSQTLHRHQETVINSLLSNSNINSNSNSNTKSETTLQSKKVMVVVKNSLLSFTNQANEWRLRRRHSLLESEEESNSDTEIEKENKPIMGMGPMVEEMESEEIQEGQEPIALENKVLSNLTSPSSEFSSPFSSLSTSYSFHAQELYYYSAAKTSKLLSHPYDEDWYIRFVLPHKKHKGFWVAKIYLY